MKTFYYKIIVVLIAIFSASSINAQYQSLFGSNNTSWNIIKGNLWGTGTDSLFTASDTVINSITYKKVFSYDLTNIPPYILSTIGFLREDSVQGKAWFFSSEDPVEHLIMDLNLNLGDTFYVEGTWNSTGGYHPVDSIWMYAGKKHVRVDQYIPRFHNGVSEKLIFIEGVSTNIGIGYQTSHIDNFPYLLCSYKDGFPIYQNNDSVLNGICIYTTVGIEEKHNFVGFNLYPNPSSDHLTIENKGSKKNDLIIEIRDFTGKLALVKSLSSFEKVTINTNAISSGIYFISIKSEEEIITTQKWVKKK